MLKSEIRFAGCVFPSRESRLFLDRHSSRRHSSTARRKYCENGYEFHEDGRNNEQRKYNEPDTLLLPIPQSPRLVRAIGEEILQQESDYI